MTVMVRSIDFFKIAKKAKVPIDDVVKAWDGEEYIPEYRFEDYMRSWSDRIKNKEEAPSRFSKREEQNGAE